MNNSLIIKEDSIKNKIHNIRGLQVILDKDLAELYGIETGNLNKAVKRNKDRFPEDFMFQLTEIEYNNLIFQIGISSSEWGGRRHLPYVFSEQGVAMLSGVLKTDTAILVSIQIMNSFVSMRKFILSNAKLFQRLDDMNIKLLDHDKKFEKIFDAIQDKSITPEKGIFYEGQIFDSYKFVSDIIKSAKTSLVLIDNYVDESVLTLFNKRNKNVSVTIFTSNLTKELKLDLEKYNSQYPNIIIKEFKHSHDRFIIIDESTVYHIGASLKDLGKKWFAFCKLDKEVFGIMDKLQKQSLNLHHN